MDLSLSSGVTFRNGNEQKVHIGLCFRVEVMREESRNVKNGDNPGIYPREGATLSLSPWEQEGRMRHITPLTMGAGGVYAPHTPHGSREGCMRTYPPWEAGGMYAQSYPVHTQGG